MTSPPTIARELLRLVTPQPLTAVLMVSAARIPIYVLPLHNPRLLAAHHLICAVTEHALELAHLPPQSVHRYPLPLLTHVQMACARMSQSIVTKVMDAHTIPRSDARTREFAPARSLRVLRLSVLPTRGSPLDFVSLINSKVSFSQIDALRPTPTHALMERVCKHIRNVRHPHGIRQRELHLRIRALSIPRIDVQTDFVLWLLTCAQQSPAITAMGAPRGPLLARVVHAFYRQFIVQLFDLAYQLKCVVWMGCVVLFPLSRTLGVWSFLLVERDILTVVQMACVRPMQILVLIPSPCVLLSNQCGAPTALA